jgi:cytidine deaminase
MKIENMIREARVASLQASSIVSGIQVGCCITTKDGGFYIGSNTEYHGHFATHAEVFTLISMLRDGHKGEDVEAVCVWFEPKIQHACGSCLQALSSYLPETVTMVAASKDGHDTKTLGELLPYAYRKRSK